MWSKVDRFIEAFNEVPGPASYNTTTRPKTTTGRLGTSRLESSLAPRNFYPGPCSYVQAEDLSKRVRGPKFQAGGKRDPFGPVVPTPGPNSYQIKHEYRPVRLQRLKSGAFASKSKRESFLGKVAPGPGIGKYTVPTGNKWDLPANFHQLRPKGFHTFGAKTSRYVYAGNLKHCASVPGPGAYDLPAFGARPRTAGGGCEDDGAEPRRPRLLGKQFEVGIKVPTFGADRGSRDTWAGPLRNKAREPGPNAYDVVKALAHLESHDVPGVSSRPSSPLHSARPSSPSCTFGAGENRHTYAGDLRYHSNIPGPGQYNLPGIGGGD